MPLWLGFGPLEFAPSKAGNDVEGFATKGEVFTWEKSGFEATAFVLDHRPARHPARPAGALGAGVSGDRRAAADLRHPAAWW